MFSEQVCQNSVGSRNAWDNSCATGVSGFQPFIITTAGGGDQTFSMYSPDACAANIMQCVGATAVHHALGVGWLSGLAIQAVYTGPDEWKVERI